MKSLRTPCAFALLSSVAFAQPARRQGQSDRLQQLPQAVPFVLSAFDFSSEEPRRAVIAGDPKTAEGVALLRAAHAIYQPRKVVLGTTGPVESFAQTLKPKDGRATAYVRTGTACQAPTHDGGKLKRQLQ